MRQTTQVVENRESKPLEPFKLLPAPEGTCPECAFKHDPEEPHNQESIYWMYHFYAEHRRWPTWTDAMAHCSAEMKAWWISALRGFGIEVPE